MSRWFVSYGFTDVHDDLIVGAYPLDAGDVATIAQLGVTRVLNLVEDSEYGPGQREAVRAALAAAGVEEVRMSLVDFGHLPSSELEDAVQTIAGWLEAGERAYLHCRAGWQRSAAVAAGVVAIVDGVDIEPALQQVQRRKPSANPLPHQREELLRWWDQRAAQPHWPTKPPAAHEPPAPPPPAAPPAAPAAPVTRRREAGGR